MRELKTNEIEAVSGGTEYTSEAECRAGRQAGDLTLGEYRECVIETGSGGTYKKDE